MKIMLMVEVAMHVMVVAAICRKKNSMPSRPSLILSGVSIKG